MDSHWHPPFESAADPNSPGSHLHDTASVPAGGGLDHIHSSSDSEPCFGSSAPQVNVHYEGAVPVLVPDHQLSLAIHALDESGITHGLPAFDNGNLVSAPPETFSQDQEFGK